MYQYLFVTIIAINLISGEQKSDINLQKIYQNVEAKLEEQLKQKMLDGSTSSYHSKRRSNHMWVKIGYDKALETGIIILINQVAALKDPIFLSHFCSIKKSLILAHLKYILSVH